MSKNTVKKYVRSLQAPRMNTSSRSSLLDPFQLLIDEWLRSNPHITATRIGALLREQHLAIDVGEGTLRSYVAGRRRLLVPKEVFVRAVCAPGDQAQLDFTTVSINLAGIVVVLQLFVMRLSYSGALFARISWRCDQPALFAGVLEHLWHLTAFRERRHLTTQAPRSRKSSRADRVIKTELPRILLRSGTPNALWHPEQRCRDSRWRVRKSVGRVARDDFIGGLRDLSAWFLSGVSVAS